MLGGTKIEKNDMLTMQSSMVSETSRYPESLSIMPQSMVESKEKTKTYNQNYYIKNKTKILKYSKEYAKHHPENIQKKRNTYNRKHPERRWAESSIHGHKRKGYDVQIDIYELEQIAKQIKQCQYCGNILIYATGKNKTLDETPTMDRINREKVITKNNIQIICHKCNAMKSYRKHDEFIQQCIKIVKFMNI
jgi:hypothetical protein